MRVYTCTTFEGFWPVGTAAVVVAPTRAQAATILNARLKAHGLKPDVTMDDLQLVDLSRPGAAILRDGNY